MVRAQASSPAAPPVGSQTNSRSRLGSSAAPVGLYGPMICTSETPGLPSWNSFCPKEYVERSSGSGRIPSARAGRRWNERPTMCRPAETGVRTSSPSSACSEYSSHSGKELES